ncbi:gluconate 2-dehydrogenase subunit 3 family protein [Neolewinella persica]|uniref:gluconate 2-dehydrogenase subunit 3 family protein n=1 Tax=Neolewinella persica TaxID=70998 RepID=UPI000372CE81|nr:gluconate 2-dehydrogenase subunit 3 family protein [Neolewinella persica]
MNRRDALRKTGLLAGATMAAPSLLALLQSCQAEPRVDWQPEFLTEDEAVFVSSFVDTLLPRTDTPGALDVKADMFMDKIWAHTADEAGQAAVRADIAKFNTDCKEQHGKPFAELSEGDRMKVLTAAESTSPTFNGGVWGTAVGKQEPVGFYRSLKSMAIWAYSTSEKVGTEVLNYDPIPGDYIGCLPLEEVGNKWSL